MLRRTVFLPVLAIAASIAGCGVNYTAEWPSLPNPIPTVPALKGDAPAQQDVIGDVRITTEICLGAFSGGTGEITRVAKGIGSSCKDQTEAALAMIDGRTTGSLPTGTAATRRARRAAPTHADVAKAGFSEVSLGQVLVSYRVPEGSAAPETLSGAVEDDAAFTAELSDRATCLFAQMKSLYTGINCGALPEGTPRQEVEFPEAVGFTRSDSLSAELEAADPAGDGQKWVGYISEQVPWALTGVLTVHADFGLPVPEDGSTFEGPFEHETRMGLRSSVTQRDVDAQELLHDAAMWLSAQNDIDDPCDFFGPEYPGCDGNVIIFRDGKRIANAVEPVTKVVADYDPARAVDCDEQMPPVHLVDDRDDTPGSVTAAPVPTTICSLEAPEGVVADLPLETRDLRVEGGAVSAEQGQTAAVPFTLDYDGPAGGALELTGETDLPFSSATTLSEWTPAADEQRTETVAVPVPADARPGVYEVVLSVGSGDAVRTAVGRLTVTAKKVAGTPATALPEPEQRVVTIDRFTTLVVERLFVGRDGSVAFGFVCPADLADACQRGVAEVLASGAALKRASAAAAGPAKMKRLGSTRFTSQPGKRTRVKVKLGRTGRKAIAKGRRIDARLVLRVGKFKQVRKITLRRG